MAGFFALAADTLKSPAVAGALTLGLSGSAMYLLRDVPREIGKWLLLLISREVCVTNDNYAYEWVERWLANHPYTRSQWCRNLSLRVMPSETVEHDDYEKIFSPGFAYHLMWYNGWPIVIDHWRDEGGTATAWGRKQEGIRVRIFFGPRKVAEDMLDEAEACAKNIRGRVPTHLFVGGAWERASPLRPRALDTVHMPEGIVDGLISDAEAFIGSQDWYSKMGIPYRRGYLFAGPPGTGKTTLAIALASHFMRPVYVAPLVNMSDTELTAAVVMLPKNAILLLEDIDTVAQSSERAGKPEENGIAVPAKLSLGGLLNAIDGVFTSEGRILVMTTNHPDKLDAALVRPGRVDKRIDCKRADAPVIAAMFNAAYRLSYPPSVFEDVGDVSPAVVQGALLSHRGSPASALEALSA